MTTTKPLRLSHSQAGRFQTCGQSYKYHYMDKLRSTTKSAALFFGSAIDKALDAMLKDKAEGYKLFDSTWATQDINGKPVDLKTSTLIVYANSDYDEELLHPEDVAELEGGLEAVAAIYKQKDVIGFDLLSKEKKQLLNKANWLCLRRKGHVMLKALADQVLPNITEVLATQAFVELKNETGDTVIGYADLICRYKGYDEPIIFDLKTAARPYEADSVLTSPQLALYVYGLYDQYKTNKAGYIVLSKQIRKNKLKICSKCGNDGSGKTHKTCDALGADGKRCHGDWTITVDPEAAVQILIDDVPQRTQDIVIENMEQVAQAVKNNVFTRSFSSCVKPYGKCEFWGMCYKESMDGLVKEEEK